MSTRKIAEAVAMTVQCSYCKARPGRYCQDFRGGSAPKIHAKRLRASEPWIVHHRNGWCALPPGAEPDPEAFNDPTLCGYVVTMRGGSDRGMPDCPECLARLTAQAAEEAGQ